MTDRKEHFFEPVARFLGTAYLRYSFTKGTRAEVERLLDLLSLRPGETVLDVGCGPGRHSRALAQHRLKAAGLDISETFIRLAAESRPEGAAFIRGDVRRLPIRPSSVDAVICLCQGGFGLLGGEGDEVAPLAEMAGALRPGGRIALSAFSAYFAVRFKEEGDTFDADRGVNHERSDMVGSDGTAATYDLWTTCFTPRELRLMCDAAGLTVRHLWSVTPGRYRCDPPGLDQPELLLIADKA